MEDSFVVQSLIRLIGKNIGALEKNKMSCCGVTAAQSHTILEIGIAGEISLIELAENLNLNKSTMSRTIDNLVKQGIVTRLIDETNRRYVIIKLTDKGRQIYDLINTNIYSYCSQIIKEIPAGKKDQVMESLMILVEILNKNACC